MFPIHKNTSVKHPCWIFRLLLNHSVPKDIPQLRTRHGMALALGRKAFIENTHTLPVSHDTVVSVNAVAQCILHTCLDIILFAPRKINMEP